MKIEKINDRQIRCTLTKEDLASREIKLSELAYGSDKAKALFQDMMQQAAEDFGFEAENMPARRRSDPGIDGDHRAHHHKGRRSGRARHPFCPLLSGDRCTGFRYHLPGSEG